MRSDGGLATFSHPTIGPATDPGIQVGSTTRSTPGSGCDEQGNVGGLPQRCLRALHRDQVVEYGPRVVGLDKAARQFLDAHGLQSQIDVAVLVRRVGEIDEGLDVKVRVGRDVVKLLAVVPHDSHFRGGALARLHVLPGVSINEAR